MVTNWHQFSQVLGAVIGGRRELLVELFTIIYLIMRLERDDPQRLLEKQKLYDLKIVCPTRSRAFHDPAALSDSVARIHSMCHLELEAGRGHHGPVVSGVHQPRLG